MKKLLVVAVGLMAILVIAATATFAQEPICRMYGVYDPAGVTCSTKSQINISIDYPQALMESDLLIKQTVEQFVKDQQMQLFTTFLAYPYYADTLKITQTTYRHSPNVVSVRFDMNTATGGAHPWTSIGTFTFDLKAHQILGVGDLFRK